MSSGVSNIRISISTWIQKKINWFILKSTPTSLSDNDYDNLKCGMQIACLNLSVNVTFNILKRFITQLR